jgi:hypothetical protein
VCVRKTRQRMTNRTNPFLSPFVAVTLLLVLLAACGPTAPATGPVASVPPTAAPIATPLPAPATVPPSPPPPTAARELLALAQQALSAYEPVTDAQPVVNVLLSSIASWLDAGGEPSTLETILNETPMEAKRGPVTVTELDLTGGPKYRARDIVVRIPAMGLPLLVFVNQDGSPARFAGYALPPDLEAIRTDFPLETTEIDKPALQLEDLTGDGVPEVLFASMFAGASNYRLRPKAYRWQDGDFRLVFAADLVSWAGRSDYALEPDPTGKGSLQIVLTYPHLYTHGFDHKMINHPAGQQVWRWNPDAEKFVLSEEQVHLEQSGWESGSEPGLPVTAEDRLRWLTNEGEAAFRAGRYDEAVLWYEQVLAEAGAEDWQPQEDEADWQAYAAFRRAETLLLPGQRDEGLPAMQTVAAELDGDLLGELTQAFLEGYGEGVAPLAGPDAAARGVAALSAVDLYDHFYYERPGTLRFPMDAPGILYPGAGLAAYLNAHPQLAGDPAGLHAGLEDVSFAVEEVALLDSGDLRITLRPPSMPYAGQNLVPWLLTEEGGGWRVSLPSSEGEWPTLGMFAWATPAPVLATTCMNEEGVVFTVPVGPDGVQYGAEQTGPMALTVAGDGTFWIADTQGNRLLHYDPQGVQLKRIDLNGYGVYGAADVEPAGSDILALCCGRVLRLTAGGDLLAAYDIPNGLGPEGGLTGLAVGDQGEILLEFMMGAEVAQLVDAQGALEPLPLSGYTHEGKLYKARQSGSWTSQGTIVAGSARIEVTVPNILAGLRILGFAPAGNFYVVVDEMVSTPTVWVDKTVHLYDPAGELLGLARVPVAERYTYVQNGLAVGPDGCVYALLTRPDQVDVVRLGFSAELEPILPTPVR